MIGIEIRFLAGRFHATDWYHAHNEGVTEWPPSPWRVLRALVASAYHQGVDIERAAALLEKLRPLPKYRLPAAREAHTRHYMPDVDDASHKKAKVFDSFIAIDGGAANPQPLLMAWPGELTADEHDLLTRLTRSVGYLGRAESWAELKVVAVEGERFDCTPDEVDSSSASTRLMSLEPEVDLSAWASSQPPPKKKSGLDVPRSLWDVLSFSGERFRAEGWTRVPGTQARRYVFAAHPFRGRTRARAVAGHSRVPDRPTAAEFTIQSSVLPKATDALSVCERVRRALMSRSENVSGDARAVFAGHGENAVEHQHAYYLPAVDDRGRIDRVVVSAAMGFEDEDIRALQSLRSVWGRGGHDLNFVLTRLWSGDAADLKTLHLLGSSKIWTSVTPFVPTRHPKVVRGKEVDSIPDQVRKACLQSGIGATPVTIEPVAAPRHHQSWSRYQRWRLGGHGRRGPDFAFGLRLEFDRPVRGPIALGYGAHYGLGVFEPVI